MARGKRMNTIHEGARGLQQRHQALVGIPSYGLGQMKIEPGLRAAALVLYRAIARYRNEIRSAR